MDFLQIDAEGYDARIIGSIEFRQTKPSIICYEEGGLPHSERYACRAKLAAKGYRFGTWDGVVVACLPEVLPIWDERLRQLELCP
jgi:hypothetical protein